MKITDDLPVLVSIVIIQLPTHRSGSDEIMEEVDVLCNEIVTWWREAEDKKKEPNTSTEAGKQIRKVATQKLKEKSKYIRALAAILRQILSIVAKNLNFTEHSVN